MRREELTEKESMEIEVRLLKEAAARFGGVLNREREKRRAAYRRARAVCDGREEWGTRR